METVDNAEVRIAVSEFHQYLSDHIAPLMFTDSAELLLRYPASALAGEVNRWKGAQATRAPGVAAADFLFHAVKKFAVMGELDLVSKTDLATYLKDRVYAGSCGLKTAFLGNGGRNAATIFSLRYPSSR